MTFPIMKDGFFGCGTVNKGKESFCVENTFRSSLQILLPILSENHDLQEMDQDTINHFLHIVIEIGCNGLTGPHPYNLRTKVLFVYLGKKNRD